MRGHKAPGLPLAFERSMVALAEQAVDVVAGSKRCSRCKRVKRLDLFPVRNDRPCGRHSWCRTCKQIYTNELNKTDAARERDRLYRQRPDQKIKKAEYNRTRLAEYRKAYWQTPRGKLINRRNAARQRVRRATTEEQRARAARLVTAYDAELRRMDAARAREAG